MVMLWWRCALPPLVVVACSSVSIWVYHMYPLVPSPCVASWVGVRAICSGLVGTYFPYPAVDLSYRMMVLVCVMFIFFL